MKKLKYQILFAILFMTIGVAAVTTNLVLNGTTSLTNNPDDFDVYFSDYVDFGDSGSYYVNADVSVFSDKKITFTGVLRNLRDQIGINVDITNASKNYDADVTFRCSSDSTYLFLDYGINSETISARETVTGGIIVNLIKTYTGDTDLKVEISCTIDATAVERGSLKANEVDSPLELSFNVGDEITIDTEKFNVISDNGDTVTMLAQYNIGKDYKQTSTSNEVIFSDNNGWEYTPGPKEIDIQEWSTNPKLYINEYIEFLKNETNDLSLSGDLITLNQLSLLGCKISSNYSSDVNNQSCVESFYNDWLINGQSMWTKSSFSTVGGSVWRLNNFGTLSFHYYNTSGSVRPVITISKAALEGKLITFTIADVSYNATEGMTWGEWVDSEYNTSDFILDDVYVVNSRYYKISCNGLVISSNDYINSGSSYKFTSGYQSQ